MGNGVKTEREADTGENWNFRPQLARGLKLSVWRYLKHETPNEIMIRPQNECIHLLHHKSLRNPAGNVSGKSCDSADLG